MSFASLRVFAVLNPINLRQEQMNEFFAMTIPINFIAL